MDGSRDNPSSAHPIRVAVVGARGRMGILACGWIEAEKDLALVARIEIEDDLKRELASSRAVVALDFTTASTARVNALAIAASGVRPVVGTSGLHREDLAELRITLDDAGIGGIVVPNFSLGAVLAMRFSEEAARHFPGIEVLEAHSDKKADAPSGTARATAERMASVRSGSAPALDSSGFRGGSVAGIPVHSLRLPGVIAYQEAWLSGDGEVLRIVHETTDRTCFRQGILLAVRSAPRVRGLVVGLESLLFPEDGEGPGGAA
jgi:4-hydroxy-tetrahydrodipicolinate reductase